MALSDEERREKKNTIQRKYRARPEIRAKYNESNKVRMRKYNKNQM